MQLQCGDFQSDGEIPVKFTCQGEDVSPALSWNGVPREAASLALLCEDPDAPGGMWVHWVDPQSKDCVRGLTVMRADEF